MEDAATIAALLPLGTSPGDIPRRLELFEQARYGRVYTLQAKTRETVRNPILTVGNPVFAREEWGKSNTRFAT